MTSGPLEVSYRLVADLIPYARNSRTHSDEQVAQIAASIREFGFTNPVLVDGASGLIAGHGRVLAARKFGLESVPCIDPGPSRPRCWASRSGRSIPAGRSRAFDDVAAQRLKATEPA